MQIEMIEIWNTFLHQNTKRNLFFGRCNQNKMNAGNISRLAGSGRLKTVYKAKCVFKGKFKLLSYSFYMRFWPKYNQKCYDSTDYFLLITLLKKNSKIKAIRIINLLQKLKTQFLNWTDFSVTASIKLVI